VNHALAKVLIRYFIINFLKIKLKKKIFSPILEHISLEALQKVVRIIWSFAFECRLNYPELQGQPTQFC